MSLSFEELCPSDFENCFDWRPESFQPASILTDVDYPKAVIDSPSRFIASGSSLCQELMSQGFPCASFEDEVDERDSTTLSKVTLSPASRFKMCEKRSETSNLGGCSTMGRFSGEREESQMLYRSMESCYNVLDKKLEAFRDRELSYITSYRGLDHFEELLPVKKVKSNGGKFKVSFSENCEELSRANPEKSRKFWKNQACLSKLVSQSQLDLVEHIRKAAEFKDIIKEKKIHASVFEDSYKAKMKTQIGIDCDQLLQASSNKKQRKETLLSLDEVELKSCSTVNLKQKRNEGKISKKAVKRIHKELEAIKSFSKTIVNRALVQE